MSKKRYKFFLRNRDKTVVSHSFSVAKHSEWRERPGDMCAVAEAVAGRPCSAGMLEAQRVVTIRNDGLGPAPRMFASAISADTPIEAHGKAKFETLAASATKIGAAGGPPSVSDA